MVPIGVPYGGEAGPAVGEGIGLIGGAVVGLGPNAPDVGWVGVEPLYGPEEAPPERRSAESERWPNGTDLRTPVL